MKIGLGCGMGMAKLMKWWEVAKIGALGYR